MKVFLIILSIVIVFIEGCSKSTEKKGFSWYKKSVKQKYYKAMDALSSGNYELAKKLFQKLSNESSVLKYSMLARLRLGDTLLAEGSYDSALYVFEEFLKQYKGNKNEAYAFYRMCQCYDFQIPSDLAILPPPESKDTTYINQARSCYSQFLSTYKHSRFYFFAKKRFDYLNRLLYKHEILVASFYFKHKKYRGVILRLKQALTDYPVLSRDENLYYKLIMSLIYTNNLTEARKYYNEYSSIFPSGKYVLKFRSYLNKVKGNKGEKNGGSS